MIEKLSYLRGCPNRRDPTRRQKYDVLIVAALGMGEQVTKGRFKALGGTYFGRRIRRRTVARSVSPTKMISAMTELHWEMSKRLTPVDPLVHRREANPN